MMRRRSGSSQLPHGSRRRADRGRERDRGGRCPRRVVRPRRVVGTATADSSSRRVSASPRPRLVYAGAARALRFGSWRRCYCCVPGAGARGVARRRSHLWSRTAFDFAIIAHIDHGKSTLADRIPGLTGTVAERTCASSVDSMDPRARARDHDQGAGGARALAGPRPAPDRHAGARGLQLRGVALPAGVRGRAPARRCVARASRRRRSRTPTSRSTTTSRSSPSRTRSTSRRRTRTRPRSSSPTLVGDDPERVLRISAKTGEGVEAVLDAIVERIPPPAGDPEAPARALVFDSVYDQYRGVVAFVRVVDGSFETGSRCARCSRGRRSRRRRSASCRRRGLRVDSLSAGEVGYVITGLKDVSRLRVGDTLTSRRTVPRASRSRATRT